MMTAPRRKPEKIGIDSIVDAVPQNDTKLEICAARLYLTLKRLTVVRLD